MIRTLDLERLYHVALRIRLVESKIAELYPEGKMRCPVHLSIGQEITSAVFEQIKLPGDTAISTHRAHAHYLAMGGDLPKMIAEIYGKVTGCSRGRGGSMHLIDIEKGFLGSSAIVGNSIPIGVGVGYTKMLSQDGGVSFIFLGDGAVEEGAFYESANFAAVHKLPVMFILENNLYSVYTNLGPRQPAGRSPSKLAALIGLNSTKVEDSNFQDVFTQLDILTEQTRNGAGPSLIEISTYRKLEHCGPNDDDILGYRPEAETRKFKDLDLVLSLEHLAIKSAQQKNQIVTEIEKEIESAFNFAESSPFPSYLEATEGVYAS
jgi:pyruvate dehydrogenase E1 component alpha subunit